MPSSPILIPRPLIYTLFPYTTLFRSDHDPLYRFHQWQANLRVLAVQEIKTVPYVPLSHPFLERLLGTSREYLDQTLFWTAADLENKLRLFQDYFNRQRAQSGSKGIISRVIS